MVMGYGYLGNDGTVGEVFGWSGGRHGATDDATATE